MNAKEITHQELKRRKVTILNFKNTTTKLWEENGLLNTKAGITS